MILMSRPTLRGRIRPAKACVPATRKGGLAGRVRSRNPLPNRILTSAGHPPPPSRGGVQGIIAANPSLTVQLLLTDSRASVVKWIGSVAKIRSQRAETRSKKSAITIRNQDSETTPPHSVANGTTDKRDRSKLLNAKGLALFHPLANRLANGPTDADTYAIPCQFCRSAFPG